jgi:hypothetical protein
VPSGIEKARNWCSPTVIVSESATTSSGRRPRIESNWSKCAIVFRSPRSFTATISKPARRSSDARRKFRPIRPKPLMATRVIVLDLGDGHAAVLSGRGPISSVTRRVPGALDRQLAETPGAQAELQNGVETR